MRKLYGDAQRGKWYNLVRMVVWYDGRRTICGRQVMALWHTFQCFQDDKPMLPCKEA